VTGLAARATSRDLLTARARPGPLLKNPDKGWGCRVSAEFKRAFSYRTSRYNTLSFVGPQLNVLQYCSLKE
jgi:hypothetical protein